MPPQNTTRIQNNQVLSAPGSRVYWQDLIELSEKALRLFRENNDPRHFRIYTELKKLAKSIDNSGESP